MPAHDVKIALRMLRRSPAFTLAAVATLALGIGANTAIFSLIDATLLEPLPYPDSGRIVQIWLTTPTGDGVTLSIPEFNTVREQNAIFENVAAYDFGGPGLNITGNGEPEQVKAIHVSRDYFQLFGAHVETGRTFAAEEDRPNSARVVVLSHGLWVRRFHADPNLIGRTISLGNEPYLVTGVLAAGFQPDPPAQIWLPLQGDPNSTGQAHYIRTAARLRSGISLDQANAGLKLSTAEFLRKFPLFNQKAGFRAKPLRETSVHDLRTPLLVLYGAVTLVLLIACSNVANLLLARASARQREIAIRAALGASRGRIISQLLTESLLLSSAGGILGFAAGRLGLRSLLALNPEAIPGTGAIPLEWRVLGFAAALALSTTVLFGLLPALRTSRAGLNQRSGATREAVNTKSVLVSAQIAMAVTLVIGAALMIRTLAALRAARSGINPHHILTMQMSLAGTRFGDTAVVTRLVQDGVDRLHSIPGVEAAATSWTLPVELAFSSSFIIEGRPLGDNIVHGGALMRPVSPDFAAVFNISVVRGRFFTERDTSDAPSVAVISEAMAQKFWPHQDPIGQRIILDKYLGPDFAAPPREIIGIAADVRDLGISQDPEPMVYVPQSQVPDGMTRIDAAIIPITWSIRTLADPYSLSRAIQRELRIASGGLAVAQIRSMDEVVKHSTVRSDFNTVLLIAFAASSLLLAAIGIYGLIAFSVQQRKQEIGIRLALGAAPSQVRSMVVWQGIRLTAIGVALGLLLSSALVRYMATLVYGVKPADAGVRASAALTLGVVAVLASYIPALRASQSDPASVLRAE